VYLIATDTLESAVCAWAIQAWFVTKNDERFTKVHFSLAHNSVFVIKDLRVDKSTELVERGFSNLLSFIKERAKIQISNNSTTNPKLRQEIDPNIVLNVTGGFKAIIPFMTVFANLYNWDISYTFEDIDSPLITLPPLPINFDTTLAEIYYPYLDDINLNNLDFVNENQAILKEIESSLLIRKKENQTYATSIFGRVFMDYLESQWELSNKNNFSFIVEHKVFEHRFEHKYVNETNTFMVKHKGFNIVGVSEIDILLKTTNGAKFIDTEVKSALMLLDNTGLEKIKQQFSNRYIFYKTPEARIKQLFELAEFHFIAYRIVPAGAKTSDVVIKNRMELLKTHVESKGVVFKGFLITVEDKNITFKRQNALNDFIANPLKNLIPLIF
jgi:hypothetical protein